MLKHVAERPIRIKPHAHVTSSPVVLQTASLGGVGGSFQTSDEEDFNAVFSSSAEALLVMDANGIIQCANLRASELLHYRQDGLKISTPGEHLAQPPREEFSKLCALQEASNALACVDGLLTTGSRYASIFVHGCEGREAFLSAWRKARWCSAPMRNGFRQKQS